MTENDRDTIPDHTAPAEKGTDVTHESPAEEKAPPTPLIALTPLGDAANGKGAGMCAADGCSL